MEKYINLVLDCIEKIIKSETAQRIINNPYLLLVIIFVFIVIGKVIEKIKDIKFKKQLRKQKQKNDWLREMEEQDRLNKISNILTKDEELIALKLQLEKEREKVKLSLLNTYKDFNQDNVVENPINAIEVIDNVELNKTDYEPTINNIVDEKNNDDIKKDKPKKERKPKTANKKKEFKMPGLIVDTKGKIEELIKKKAEEKIEDLEETPIIESPLSVEAVNIEDYETDNEINNEINNEEVEEKIETEVEEETMPIIEDELIDIELFEDEEEVEETDKDEYIDYANLTPYEKYILNDKKRKERKAELKKIKEKREAKAKKNEKDT